MYAHVVYGGSHPPDKRDAMNQFVREVLIPALQQEPGFRGALNLVDPSSGNGIMLTFWETEAQALSPRSGETMQQAISKMQAITQGRNRRAPAEVYAVNAFVMDGSVLQ